MKIAEIPETALSAPPTPIPTVVMYDWEALFNTLQTQGFIVIESDNLRLTSKGADECVPVKMFNSYVRQNKHIPLRTKRISKFRWFCTL